MAIRTQESLSGFIAANPVRYCIITYDGAHTPLVDSETWLRVQAQLDAKNAVGERPQKYDHYLKGSLYCSCGAKLMIERPRDKNGDRYEYFTCSGRRRKRTPCTRSAILAERIEQRIEATYNTNGLTKTKPNGYTACCTGCSTSSKPPATTNASSLKHRRTSSKQNDSSSSRRPLRRRDPSGPAQERAGTHPHQPRPDHQTPRHHDGHLYQRPRRSRRDP